MVNIDAFYGSHNRQNFSRNNMLGLGQTDPGWPKLSNTDIALSGLAGGAAGYLATKRRANRGRNAALGAGAGLLIRMLVGAASAM